MTVAGFGLGSPNIGSFKVGIFYFAANSTFSLPVAYFQWMGKKAKKTITNEMPKAKNSPFFACQVT